MATIEDVAKLAGVSAMTVSRYINESGYVGEKTKEKIIKAIDTLNYRPNMIAKSLVTKKTKTIGHVVASIVNPFYPDVVLGVEDESYERGYNVILCNADGKKKEQEYIEILLDKCVDGIIFDHLNITAKQVLELNNLNVSCVLIDNETQGISSGNVVTNDILGGYLATEHLISLGHRKIALIHGSLNFNEAKKKKVYTETFQFSIWNNRMRGFLDAMEKYRIKVNSNFIVEGDGTAENGVKGGYEAMKRLLAQNDLPTAVYAQNDLMAAGAMSAIYEAGYKIPGDFSIIGHDGISLGEVVFPKLTTVEQPRYEIGRTAAGLLIEMNEDTSKTNHILLNPKLLIRASTGKL